MPRRGVIPRIEAAGRGIVIKIEGDGESARKALEMVQEHLRDTAETAKHEGGVIADAMEEAVNRIKRVVEFEVIYEGLRMALEGMKELVVGSLELGEALKQSAQKTGLSVETLSVLHYASKELGTDFDGLVTGIGRFDKNIASASSGNKTLAADFKAMGLNAKELASQTDGSEVAFHKFIDTLAATSNEAQRNKLATDMMGKAGIAQIPVLIELSRHWDELRQKAADAGQLMDGETAESLAHLNQQLNDMKQHILGAGLAFTEGLTPGMSQMMDVIAGGKSSRDELTSWGEGLVRLLSVGATMAYGLASGLATVAAIGDGGPLTKGGRDMLEQAKELDEKARKFLDISTGSAPKPGIDYESMMKKLVHGGEAKPFVAPPEGGKPAKSGNGIAEAAVRLAEEQTKLVADVQKSADQVKLAKLEAQHKMLLVSDQEFYSERLRLLTDELDLEQKAIEARQKTLQDRYAKQHGDKTAKRDGNGNSAEELKTQRELVQLKEQLEALKAKRAQVSSTNAAEVDAANRSAKLANLKVAAELEKERNSGIEARTALIQHQTDLEVTKTKNSGGSDADIANVRAAGELQIKQLQIADINRQIEATLNDNKRATEAWNKEAEKNPLLKGEAEKQINQLNKQAAQSVQELMDKYYALAVTIGGPTLEAAKNLKAQIAEMSVPSQKGDAQMFKSITEGVTGMANTIAEQTVRGKTSFKQMVKEIESDLVGLAMKLMEQKFMSTASASAAGGGSFWANIFGASAEHHMSGGQIDGPSVVGEDGPEIYVPPQNGGSIIPNGLSTQLAKSGGGMGGVSVTSNVINQTRNPVQAQPSQVSYDAEMKTFIIHTVLEDASSGGPTSALAGGGGG